ncbi:MAG: hypothetical protein B6I28_01570 [Fusobacteriia bacterium 4572_132]|nr:MAG: hypothetical protein B6I28_01570 [Fusobacteriia bacterium 4572_132]
MKSRLLVLLFCISIFSYGTDLFIKGGEILSGEILSETENEIELKTEYGILRVDKKNLIETEQIIEMKNGDILNGKIKERRKKEIVVKTKHGILTIANNKINNIYYSKKMEDYEEIHKEKFYKAEEKIMDVFMEPTGNVMEAGSFYLSGLSYGFGLTDNFQITSNWSEYFSKNLNIRPKLKIFEKMTQKGKHQLSLGGTLNLKYPKELLKKTEWESGDEPATEILFFSELEENTEDVVALEPFIAYTYEMEKSRGKHALTLGASSLLGVDKDGITHYFDKAFLTYWFDISPKIIMLAGLKTNYNVEGEYFLEKEAIDYMDIGFIYSYKKDLRIGIHFQEPYFTFYYRIY